jgi:hypothetical protein
MSGFHGDIKSSHLPENVKRALLGYEHNIRTGIIKFDDNGHPIYTEDEIAQMTRLWGHRYVARHPLARDFQAEMHTLTPEQADAFAAHTEHFTSRV